MSAMSEANTAPGPVIKGIGFLGLFKFIKLQPQGAELLARVFAALPPDTAQLLGKKVNTIKDYPYDSFIKLIRAVDNVQGRGDLSKCFELGVFTSNRDYESLYGSGARRGRLKPEDLLRDCGVFWKSYYQNAGYMQTIHKEPGNTLVRIYDFPQMDPAHCEFMTGWMAQAMVNAGAEWYDFYESGCPSRGDPYHDFTGSWQMKTQQSDEIIYGVLPKLKSRVQSVEPQRF